MFDETLPGGGKAVGLTMMNMFRIFARCRSLLAAALLVAAAATGAAAQTVVVIVNGEPITALDVDQRIRFMEMTTQKKPARQEILNELIDEKLKVREAKRYGIEIGDAEVDTMFATMANRMRLNPDQLSQNLMKGGVNPSTLKARIRADTVWQQLVRGRFQSSLQLSEREVDAALQGQEVQDTTAIEYIMRPILLLVPPGSPPAVYDSRRKEAEALRSRFRSCDEGIPATRAMRDAAIRDQVIRNSGDLPPELRKVLDAVPVGQLTTPEVTKLGVEMFAVCAKQDAKTDAPGKRKARETIFTQRFERQSKQYLQRLRNESMVERK
ncbi:MAG: peptidyl-prolyl cis-trans isomerase SurA [Alphaproteobacteria bacterium]|nr:peptidyl-prolyl cis-trans isomerase SurA [Alphaproteobacteria bacterium]